MKTTRRIQQTRFLRYIQTTRNQIHNINFCTSQHSKYKLNTLFKFPRIISVGTPVINVVLTCDTSLYIQTSILYTNYTSSCFSKQINCEKKKHRFLHKTQNKRWKSQRCKSRTYFALIECKKNYKFQNLWRRKFT